VSRRTEKSMRVDREGSCADDLVVALLGQIEDGHLQEAARDVDDGLSSGGRGALLPPGAGRRGLGWESGSTGALLGGSLSEGWQTTAVTEADPTHIRLGLHASRE
jgi:hypothetical protein